MMRSKNFLERRKRIIAFAGIYAASIMLLLFILSAFGMRFSPADQNVAMPVPDAAAQADVQLLHADSVLHGQLQTLQQLDLASNLMDDSATHHEHIEAVTNIRAAEAALQKTIDSVQSLTEDYSSRERARYSAMLSTFRLSLNKRLLFASTQVPAATGNAVLKEDNISRLQAEIKRLQEAAAVPSKAGGLTEAQKGETEVLRTAFSDQQKELDALKDKYAALKNDNSTLNARVGELKKNIVAKPGAGDADGSGNEAAAARINVLGQQIETLNADLTFTKIDCNLARTDAQQMISNARQRKELLSETLSMLNRLVKSGDTDIQRKAKERIDRLNHIATTLHD